MSLQNEPNAQRRRGATSAQLKDDIDSGRTGDKVGGFDPAASPLGTDDEAGGAPHDPALIARTREQERGGRPASATITNAATPELQPNAAAPARSYIGPAVLGVILALALVAVMVMLL